MPRRGQYPVRGVSVWKRIQAMLSDRRTWTTILYLVLMLPLGIIYFTVAVTGIAVSLACIGSPIMEILHALNVVPAWVQFGDQELGAGIGIPASLLVGALGVLILTGYFHVIRAVGKLHGQLAKALLVAQDGV